MKAVAAFAALLMAIGGLSAVIAAVPVPSVSNGFALDTRPSPQVVGAVLEKFTTEPMGLTIFIR